MKRSTFLKTLLIAPFAGVASLSVLANAAPKELTPLDRVGIRRCILILYHQAEYYARVIEHKFGDQYGRQTFMDCFSRYLKSVKERGAIHSYAWYFYSPCYSQPDEISKYGVELYLKPRATSEWIKIDMTLTPEKHKMVISN